jgi:hypothetical protein
VAVLEAIMKYLLFVALSCVAVGCGGSEPAPEDRSVAPGGDPRDAERAQLRGKINAKRRELDAANNDLSKVASEREELSGKPASNEKTNRLIELARIEQETKQKKASLTDDIADLQQQLGNTSSAPSAKPSSKAGDALDDLLTDADKGKTDAERRRQKMEDDAAADKARIAQAEAARNAELDERSKQKIEGGRLAQGADGPVFEERWADVIQKVQAELQKFKRW